MGEPCHGARSKPRSPLIDAPRGLREKMRRFGINPGQVVNPLGRTRPHPGLYARRARSVAFSRSGNAWLAFRAAAEHIIDVMVSAGAAASTGTIRARCPSSGRPHAAACTRAGSRPLDAHTLTVRKQDSRRSKQSAVALRGHQQRHGRCAFAPRHILDRALSARILRPPCPRCARARSGEIIPAATFAARVATPQRLVGAALAGVPSRRPRVATTGCPPDTLTRRTGWPSACRHTGIL